MEHYALQRIGDQIDNLAGVFYTRIEHVLDNARFKAALAYLDDVNITSKTAEVGLENFVNF